jgi:penicillin-binding protein-related factor A (putative recombinase)
MNTGKAAENTAEYVFNVLSWQMVRLQPETIHTRAGIVQLKSQGQSDYIGCNKKGEMVLCEVKDAGGKTKIPASRLKKQQRDFMDKFTCCKHKKVFVLFRNGQYRVFDKIETSGSYKL